MPTRRRLVHAVPVGRVALVCIAVTASLSAGPSSRQAGQPATTAQTPSFRAAANFVQVDVYPTANGRVVADLSKDDFEVFEDGVAQSVATFEHVSARSGPQQALQDPGSTRNERELVADPHNRLFVIFLDSYHVTDAVASHARGADSTMRLPGNAFEGRPRGTKPLGPQPIDIAVVNFLERFIGPNDLVAAMSPEMDAGGMTFGRRPERFADWVATAWARRFSWDDMDPEDEHWALCYPPDRVGDPYGCFPQIWEEMVARRHEKLTLRALDDTVVRLGTVREGRKAVLLVSEGWSLLRSDQNLARPLPLGSFPGCPDPVPPVPKGGVRVGSDGQLRRGAENPGQSDRSACDAARVELAMLDNESTYRQLLDRANRQNVTFYPIDPRGLAVFDAPFEAAPTKGTRPEAVNADLNSLRGHLDALRNLASATDGFMSETNDLDASMKRVADDLSEYYLLGYNSTNTALDGKFRKISVRVKRPGVSVRARRGYLAATEVEVRARAAAAAPVDSAVRERETALAGLGKMPADLPLRVKTGFDWMDSAPSLWTVVELGETAARLTEWREGGEAELTVTSADGSVVASGKAPLSTASRGFVWRPASKRLEAGDYTVRVSARPTTSGSASIGSQMRVTLPAASDQPRLKVGTSRVFRRGPSTGLAFVPTVDDRFRRVERVRIELSLSGEAPISARVLDRRAQPLAVQATAVVREQDGGRLAVVEAALASLAPGDYLIEVALGDGPARQTVLTAIRIVP